MIAATATRARPRKPLTAEDAAEIGWYAPKMLEERFWDEFTAPLLALFGDGPMRWPDVEAAVALLEMNRRFMHDAVAYLEIKGLIHHEGETDVTWHLGPKDEDASE